MMDMTVTDQPPTSAFAAENARFAQLRGRAALAPAEGRRDLAEGIWLATETGRGAALGFEPGAQGFRVTLQDAGRARWMSLSWTVPLAGLRQGRYLGLRCRVQSDGFFAYRPCLRYLHREGGFRDQFPEDHVLSPGGLREQISHVPIDHAELARSSGAEVHMFFHGAPFRAEFHALETLLMV